ncbi:hypothetical protein IWX64_003043 [Arthrobacter sp. CAN_A212]|uniref:hypothetical protein n=1 Tax=Arthrobacter sp. CAN_A212 TaxID=2787719 RepID=UPI0018C93B2A
MTVKYRLSGSTLGLLAVAVALSACTSPDDPSNEAQPDDLQLLVSNEERDGSFGPQALFEGTLVVSEEDCVLAEGTDGTTYNIEFPVGAAQDPEDASIIKLEIADLVIGEDVALGGGYSAAGNNDAALATMPESCRQPETFHLYTTE